jgi:hypothetical protein
VPRMVARIEGSVGGWGEVLTTELTCAADAGEESARSLAMSWAHDGVTGPLTHNGIPGSYFVPWLQVESIRLVPEQRAVTVREGAGADA